MPKPRVAKASSSSSSSSAKCPRQGRGVGRGPSSSGGSNNAAQTILNIVATLANQTNSKTAPRDKVVAHAKLEGVLGKSTFANSLTKLRKQGLVDLSPGIISISDEGLERAQPLSQLSLCNVNGNGNGNNADYLAALKKQLKLSARASALLDELSRLLLSRLLLLLAATACCDCLLQLLAATAAAATAAWDCCLLRLLLAATAVVAGAAVAAVVAVAATAVAAVVAVAAVAVAVTAAVCCCGGCRGYYCHWSSGCCCDCLLRLVALLFDVLLMSVVVPVGEASALLDELSDGRVHSKKEAAAAIGCTMNSTWANMLTPLKKLKLIRFDRETIELTDDVFPFGRPEY
eukprot:CAMPEP_0172377246 /NCGR_PEP_ID=MMETSP1060-20121228/68801_1 /TAXON_ID=37318 /ORGANISM="Pseudo-nitzschia pungens, Strain cf. cingulata" /LENGTH=345 /DNA_ID=CAMNT_0013104923 /DNA_START=517 /DNA_END=1559 /DNA_ORIENTATION=+